MRRKKMIIRNKKIIGAQNELDELVKFQKTEMIKIHGSDNRYPRDNGDDLLHKTLMKKRKYLCQLYIKQMEIYLNKEGSKENA
jgi:hypothetical protein